MPGPLAPITFGKQRFFFQKILISSATFNNDADVAVTLTSKNSLLLINQGAGVIEVSFNGNTVHAELNAVVGPTSLAINDPGVVKIWFRLKSGTPSAVIVQNDAVVSSNTVNVSGITVGGTSSNFNDFFPAAGTAVGYNDGTKMQGARVYDIDSGAGTEFALGTVLRASDAGGSVETGTAAHPLTVDGTVTGIVRGGAKGTTTEEYVTSENIDANTQALHVYVKGISTGTGTPLNLDGYSALDAFGRFRVSSPFTIFDSKQLFDNQPLRWDTQNTSGGSTSYNSNRASTTLNVTSTVGSKSIRQSKVRTTYQPGKSLLIFTTFVMGSILSGITKKAGYFDDKNGIFLKNDGTNTSLVVRSYTGGSASDITTNQSLWNIDPLDGTGKSGITLDLTKSQIFVVDIEWLGVGSVRCGFVIDGNIYYVHKFNHANILDVVYMSTPNLPIRYEIENVASGVGASLEQICSSVSSEGGYDNKGFAFSIDRGVTSLTNVDKNQLYPLISLRVKSTYIGAQIIPKFVDLLCTSSNASFKWSLIVNPTINGVDAASWTGITNSAVEYDVSRTLTNYLTGGYVVASGYGSQKVTTLGNFIEGNFNLGTTIAGVSDQLVLAVQKIGMGTDDFIGSVTWSEFI